MDVQQLQDEIEEKLELLEIAEAKERNMKYEMKSFEQKNDLIKREMQQKEDDIKHFKNEVEMLKIKLTSISLEIIKTELDIEDENIQIEKYMKMINAMETNPWQQNSALNNQNEKKIELKQKNEESEERLKLENDLYAAENKYSTIKNRNAATYIRLSKKLEEQENIKLELIKKIKKLENNIF